MLILAATAGFVSCCLICWGINSVLQTLDKIGAANQHDLDIEGD